MISIKLSMDCQTQNFLYIILCTKCLKQYLGETSKNSRKEICGPSEHHSPAVPCQYQNTSGTAFQSRSTLSLRCQIHPICQESQREGPYQQTWLNFQRAEFNTMICFCNLLIEGDLMFFEKNANCNVFLKKIIIFFLFSE